MALTSKGFLDLTEAADVHYSISMDSSDTCSLRLAGLQQLVYPVVAPLRNVWVLSPS